MNVLDTDFDDDLPEDTPEIEITEDNDDESPIKRELLTIRLFKEAVKESQGKERDITLEIFAEKVLPNLIQQLAGATAKGGKFFEVTIEIINAKRAAAGKKPVRRDNAGDQSILAHLLNGLFPTYRILKKLQSDDVGTNRVKRHCEELQTRVFIVSYLLHDYEKFPDYQDWLIANKINRQWEEEPPKKEDAPNLGREFIHKKILDFGLYYLLGEDWEQFIDDIIEISNNSG
ncbi:MAG: type I-D CRISPR-associated protein Cas10d/Csc3, partial [Dolichospermum sp.]